jgi:hypothetical protein
MERARYLRVKAINYGHLPDWQPGKGGQAWIFIDEIVMSSLRCPFSGLARSLKSNTIAEGREGTL